MNTTNSESASQSTAMDLTEFYGIFFEEAGENLDSMEKTLLDIDLTAADDEELNAIFRCAHSVKGGAATFGFADVAALTHEMETLLDLLRRRKLVATTPMVDVLLQAGDALRAQLARHQHSGEGDLIDTSALLADIRALAAGKGSAVAAPGTTSAGDRPQEAASAGERHLELVVGPLAMPNQADSLVELFSEIVDLGSIEPLDGGVAEDGIRRFKIITLSSDHELLALFGCHLNREQVKLLPLGPGFGFHPGAPGAPPVDSDDSSFGFFDDAPGAPAVIATDLVTPAVSVPGPLANAPVKAGAAPAAATEAATLRVSVEKVDQLINLVGELVITQAMLAQTSANVDPALYQKIAAVLADFDRNTRDLQQAVMSIRMIPMSIVFSRFPRMLRDLAGKLGKKVEFATKGEATELDKGLVEKITDPLTHLVRNSCDHGIELPAERLAKGKPETGTLTLIASHQGGSIVIEVRDDGKGLSREKLISKARERGISAPDSMSDSEVWSLIFAPGFSTAEVVTDVSGRGVGMDVVKKNITALGGTVDIESTEGVGMSVKVRLPLTLAIMDSMSVGVGDECYILPLSSVVESVLLTADKLKSIGGSGRVVQGRDEFLPVIELERVFDVPRHGDEPASAIMVVVESDGTRMGLLVDELLGQQQVVVKNLESNYRKVQHVSGATIMGDGRVALILDVASLVRRSRH